MFRKHCRAKRGRTYKRQGLERLEPRLLLAGDIEFAAPVHYRTAPLPSGVLAADLNGDGTSDLLISTEVCCGDGDVFLLPGQGDGTFGLQQRFVLGGSAVTASDLDGDGDIDIVSARPRNPRGLHVVLNQGRSGSSWQGLDQPVWFPMSGATQDVSTGDFDGDGDLDVAVGHPSSVPVLLNQGAVNGVWQGFGNQVDYPAGNHSSSLVNGDIDRDGDVDIVVGNYFSGDVSVLVGTGDGTFTHVADYPVGNRGSGVKLGDLDGDEDLDIVLPIFGTRNIAVLKNNGDGTFAHRVHFPTSLNTEEVEVADLDNDGDLDVTVLTDNRVLFMTNDGSANFSEDTHQLVLTAGGVRGVALDDFDGDGDFDVAVAVGTLSVGGADVFLNQNSIPQPPTVSLTVDPPSVLEAGGIAAINATLSSPAAVPVTVDLRFSGTATGGSDYSTSGAQIVIRAGTTSGATIVTSIDDSHDELNETVIVEVTGVTNGIELGTQQQTITIVDDDEPVIPNLTLALDNTTIPEAAGSAHLTVALSQPTTEPVIVDLGMTGTAVMGDDYTASSTQVTIAPGASNVTMTVTAIQDELNETDETVIVDVTAVSGGTESGTQQQTITIIDDDEPPGLEVSSLIATASGFEAEFTSDLDTSTLNLHDGQSTGLGPADAALTGPTGPVTGSLVVDPSLRKISFIKTGDPLAPGSYTVMLRSGVNGFRDVDGQLLDGNGDGTAGDDFNGALDVAERAPNTITVGIPDFVRGPGQDANVPANEAVGIPVSISDGTDIRAIDVQISYDPSLLEITGATVAASMPSGASVVFNTTTPGRLVLVFFSATALPAGSSDFVHLQAGIPAADPDGIYGKQQMLDVHSITVSDGNDNEFPVLADDAVHLVSYLADVSGNRRINASDAAQVARVAALLDDGFAATPLTDPAMVGDISGNGRVNAADASLVARFAALIPVPEIPALPTATASSSALRFLVAEATPARDRVAVDSVDAPTEASVDNYWGNTSFQRRALNFALPDDWPAQGLKSDDSGPLEDAIDELFAAPDELMRESL